MRAFALLLISVMTLRAGEPLPDEDVPWTRSPDRQWDVMVKFYAGADEFSGYAMLYLREAGTHIIRSQIALPDLSPYDGRSGAEVLWSPDSQCVAMNSRVGRVSHFDIYRVKNGRLLVLDEMPFPEKFIPEHVRSSGGEAVERWLSAKTFGVGNYSFRADFTYRIRADWRVEVVKRRAMED